MKRLSLMLLLVVVSVGAAIFSAEVAHALTDQQNKFAADVASHGGPAADQMITPAVMETGQTLGDAVCADLRKGATANEVIGVSSDIHMPMSQAEVVVYWAITDLCPGQLGQRQDSWRDGG
ncbi:DUF732 domain-containing protein [Mycobacterium palustre]|nr:DUF732 domain-containing protein [Mycobacterium palustre]MCV7100953.1 DUF732 domain-containing protein [Mycobacterium palustre]